MRKNFLPSGNDAFVCNYCGRNVEPLTSGSYRNHCPFCLYGKHVDIIPGDRSETCQGLMQPVGVDHDSKKEWIIVYRCVKCGIVRRNKAALEDRQPDDFELIIALTSSPKQNGLR